MPVTARRRAPAALAVVAVGMFISLGAVAAAPEVADWERTTFEAVNHLPRWVWLAAWPPMQAGSLLAAPIAGLVAAALRRRRLGLQLLAAGGVGWVLARLAKAVVERPRPIGLLPDVILRGGEVGGLGYPSGHVTIAAALALLTTAQLPPRWRTLPWLVVVAVALGRMVAGAHLPLDLVGGVLLGLLVGGGVRSAAARLTRTEERCGPGG